MKIEHTTKAGLECSNYVEDFIRFRIRDTASMELMLGMLVAHAIGRGDISHSELGEILGCGNMSLRIVHDIEVTEEYNVIGRGHIIIVSADSKIHIGHHARSNDTLWLVIGIERGGHTQDMGLIVREVMDDAKGLL